MWSVSSASPHLRQASSTNMLFMSFMFDWSAFLFVHNVKYFKCQTLIVCSFISYCDFSLVLYNGATGIFFFLFPRFSAIFSSLLNLCLLRIHSQPNVPSFWMLAPWLLNYIVNICRFANGWFTHCIISFGLLVSIFCWLYVFIQVISIFPVHNFLFIILLKGSCPKINFVVLAGSPFSIPFVGVNCEYWPLL